MIIPQTEIYLIKSPLTLSNKHQITFLSKEAQETYFKSLDKIGIDDGSYQRKDGFIRYPGHIDDLINYNYCMYKNENYSDKWFYAYITNMEYENDDMTLVYIKTDVFQTWQFDLNWKQSYIEREMIDVASDLPGANLNPETLETGEYKVGAMAELDDLEPISIIAYSGDTFPNIPLTALGSMPIYQSSFEVNGISSTIAFIICEQNLDLVMSSLQQENYSNYIVACFTVPKLAVKDFLVSANSLRTLWRNRSQDIPPLVSTGIYILDNGGTFTQTKTTKTLVQTPSSLDGYTPRNQKLRQFPYLYLGYNPANGSSKIYRYEDFTNGTPVFDIYSEVNPNPTLCFVPQNYRGASGDSMSDISVLNGYPTLANKTDSFNTWLAENSQIINVQTEHEENLYNLNQGSNIINGVLGTIGNLATGNIGGAIGSAGNAITSGMSNAENHDYFIKNQMAQIERQKMLPDKVSLGSSNATLLGYGLNDKNIFTRYTIKNQFARRIDKFFDMYGYLTNELKLPNLSNRPNWNYIKTIGANILGNIPQMDLAEIKSIFDNGVTLWHDTSTFLDYSQNNR